jgi:RNA-directed DNA polymerase
LLDIPYANLAYHLYKVSESGKYRGFYMMKKSGGQRLIFAPRTALKLIQRKLSQVLYCVYKTKPSVHGFAAGRSIVTNAQKHVKKRYILNLDLLNFFPSINFGRVRGLFMGKPYYLPEEVATVLAQICCHNNQLPQGAPTSPIVSNMICAKLDSQLQNVAQKYKCTYTRYVDDITFSTTLKVFPKALAYVNYDNAQDVSVGYELYKIIEENGFSINTKKIRLRDRNSRQEVTGLTVNKFPNVSRSYIRNIRAMLHNWEKYGLSSVESRLHMDFYCQNDKLEKSRSPYFTSVLRSKIEFVGMVRGKDADVYAKLMNWYQKLISRELAHNSSSILDTSNAELNVD